MKSEGHIAGGFLASSMIVDRLKPGSKKERNQLLLLGAIAGFLPDLDYVYYAIRRRGIRYDSDFRHHTWVSHTFIFYWIPALVWYGIGKIRNRPHQQRQAAVFAAGTTAHLLQDTIGSGDGIMLFYPFTKKMSGIGLIQKHGKEWKDAYEKSPIYLVEVSIILTAIITFIYQLMKQRK